MFTVFLEFLDVCLGLVILELVLIHECVSLFASLGEMSLNIVFRLTVWLHWTVSPRFFW